MDIRDNKGSNGDSLIGTDQEKAQLAAIGAAIIALGGLGYAWRAVTSWLLSHHVLLPAGGDVVLTVPAAGGAGLDTTRVLLALAGALIALAALVGVMIQRRALRIAAEQGQVR